ncbi:MAG TPA: hypothetical protein VM487_14205 [Phycisphaerae bacterium]|nr:hypothetical protein [Phycisphaerae bacterium]HUU96887.1 hypothetical protein [Phycisphaerae bacterium]
MKYTPGTYYAEIMGGGCGTLPNEKKTPYIGIDVHITHMADGAEWVFADEGDREIKLFLSDAAWPHTTRRLASIGFNGDFDRPEFSAKNVELICTEGNNGYEDWDIAGDWVGARADRTPPPRETLKLMRAKWKTDAATRTAPTGAPSAPPARVKDATPDVAADVSDDEIPF